VELIVFWKPLKNWWIIAATASERVDGKIASGRGCRGGVGVGVGCLASEGETGRQLITRAMRNREAQQQALPALARLRMCVLSANERKVRRTRCRREAVGSVSELEGPRCPIAQSRQRRARQDECASAVPRGG
jgi:hypothetical protein